MGGDRSRDALLFSNGSLRIVVFRHRSVSHRQIELSDKVINIEIGRCRFHWKRLKRWQTANQTVKLLQKSRPIPQNRSKMSDDRVSSISAVFASPGSGPLFHLEANGVTNPAADCGPS